MTANQKLDLHLRQVELSAHFHVSAFVGYFSPAGGIPTFDRRRLRLESTWFRGDSNFLPIRLTFCIPRREHRSRPPLLFTSQPAGQF